MSVLFQSGPRSSTVFFSLFYLLLSRVQLFFVKRRAEINFGEYWSRPSSKTVRSRSGGCSFQSCKSQNHARGAWSGHAWIFCHALLASPNAESVTEEMAKFSILISPTEQTTISPVELLFFHFHDAKFHGLWNHVKGFEVSPPTSPKITRSFRPVKSRAWSWIV